MFCELPDQVSQSHGGFKGCWENLTLVNCLNVFMTSDTSWQPRSWADVGEAGSVFDTDNKLLLQETN